MSSHSYRCLLAGVVLGSLLGATVLSIQAQHTGSREHGRQDPPQKGTEHAEHGTPEGWKFTWPQGNPVKGREVFVKLECYSCHEVKGEMFPVPNELIGPELSMMAPLHDAEYFAEAIIHPNAVIQKGKGYEAADGSSKMPSYNDLVTVQEVIDLVAYLKSLKPTADAPAGHGGRSDSTGGHDRH
jgi:mono/diheme cytochrome c family protein